MDKTRSTKHLEMLQAAISRMSGYSFIAKGWSVTLAAAILGLAAKDGGPKFLWIGAFAVLLFWLIDAYYLGLEKGFRKLFDTAVTRYLKNIDIETFDMKPKKEDASILDAAFRPAILMVHPPLLISFGLAWLILK